MTQPEGCTCAHLGPNAHDYTNPHCTLFNGADLRVTDADTPEPAVHVQVVSIDGEPPPTPLGWTTTESGEHIPDEPRAAEPHAFTNFGSPGGLCTVPGCARGADHAVHRPPAQTQPVRDVKMVGVPKRTEDFVHFRKAMSYAVCGVYKADHMTVNPEEVTCGTCRTLIEPPFPTTPGIVNVFNEPIPIPPTLETLNTEISLPQLMVNVDFNDVFQIYGEEETFRLLGRLKDLLS